MRTTLISLLFASLVFTGCAAQSSVDGEEELVANESHAITATELYKAQVGEYLNKESSIAYTLNADRTFVLDTGIRCITTPCPSSDSGRWTLYSYYGRIYVNLASKTASRWFRVSSLAPVTHVGASAGLVGTWTKQEALSGPGCAATLCAAGTICVEEGGVAQCITACATVRCTSYSHCDASSGSAKCVYHCPTETTINCMPIVSPERAPYCSGEYHEWVKANCPATEFVY
jgi:hypothetical protein